MKVKSDIRFASSGWAAHIGNWGSCRSCSIILVVVAFGMLNRWISIWHPLTAFAVWDLWLYSSENLWKINTDENFHTNWQFWENSDKLLRNKLNINVQREQPKCNEESAIEIENCDPLILLTTRKRLQHIFFLLEMLRCDWLKCNKWKF